MVGITHVHRVFGVVALAALCALAWRLMAPATTHHDLIEHPLGAGGTKLVLQHVAAHPLMSEVDRFVVLVRPRKKDVALRLAMDTGGYGRTQLYVDDGGVYYLQGYFDLARIDAAAGTVEVVTDPLPPLSKYLGAFDSPRSLRAHSGANSRWRYLDASQSPERVLVARGH